METKICIVGLGYVGLPLACLASNYFDVVGYDIDENKINQINLNNCPLDDQYTKEVFKIGKFKASSDQNVIKEANIIIICVPTPIDEKHHPNLIPLKSAITTISKSINQNDLIIIESTIYPGTTEEVLIPLLEQSGLQAGKDFGLAYCPERIDPGNQKWNLSNINRVLGGIDEKSVIKAKEFYSTFINSEIKILSSLRSAEAVKILENTFRDVNIAFINEMAKSFDNLNINLIEVIEGASTKPFGFMPFYPGPGVGGHCIPVDPYYLIERAKQNGFDHNFLSLARKINNSMPEYVVNIVQDELNKLGKSVRNSKIGILGYAYKKDVDDFRESPSIQIVKKLNQKGAELSIYDPFVHSISGTNSITNLLEKSDYIVLLTNHSLFLEIEPNKFKENGIELIIDCRNCLPKEKIIELGISYRGIGAKDKD